MDHGVELTQLLALHKDRLRGFVRVEAKGLLRHESEDDLVQGIHVHALSVAGRFEYRGEREFIAWLFTVARQHVVDRIRYWSAERRDGGDILRITAAGGTRVDATRGVEPAASMTGPVTGAGRREQLALAAKVIATLAERDQQLIRWMSEDVPLEEVARRLDVGYEAAKRARLRAMERFRVAFEEAQKRPPEPSA